MRHSTNQPKCKRCKSNPVAKPGMVCVRCRKNKSASQSRAIVPIWARVLAVKEARTFSANGGRTLYLTTADMLAWAGVSMISADGRQFEDASNSASAWNTFLANSHTSTPLNVADGIGGVE